MSTLVTDLAGRARIAGVLAGIGGFVAGLRAVTEQAIIRARVARGLAGLGSFIAGLRAVAEQAIIRTGGRTRHTGTILADLTAVAEQAVVALRIRATYLRYLKPPVRPFDITLRSMGNHMPVINFLFFQCRTREGWRRQVITNFL